MINNLVLGLVRVFIERQVLKFGKALDWNMVKTDLDARIRKLVPGEYFDDAAAFVACTLISLVEAYFATKPLPELSGDATTKILDIAFTSAQNDLVRTIATKAMGK